MINYREIWKSINDESKASDVRTQIARKLPSEGVFHIFLATDFSKGLRLLYIKLDSDVEVKTESLPRFRGLEISRTVTTVGAFKDQEFLKFTQSIPDTDNIFESVISDIGETVRHIHNKEHLSNFLIKALNDWNLFFDKIESHILSGSEQKGLIGELYFLRDYVLQKYLPSEAILYWTGADRTNHDFQIKYIAVEVKSTSSKQHKRFSVASERQLDNTGLEHLYLAVYSLNIHANLLTYNLPSLIREIYKIIEDDPIAVFQFEIKLAKAGYMEKFANKYTNSFSISELKIFEVKDKFPRLLKEDLPPGVGDLKYTVAVSSCISFEIKTDILEII